MIHIKQYLSEHQFMDEKYRNLNFSRTTPCRVVTVFFPPFPKSLVPVAARLTNFLRLLWILKKRCSPALIICCKRFISNRLHTATALFSGLLTASTFASRINWAFRKKLNWSRRSWRIRRSTGK